MIHANYIILAFLLFLFSFKVQALPPHVKKGISSSRLQSMQTISQDVLKARDAMDKFKVPQALLDNIKQLKQSLPKQQSLLVNKQSRKAKGKTELVKPVATAQVINKNRIQKIVSTMRNSRKATQANSSLKIDRRQSKILDAALRKIKRIEQEVEAALILEQDMQFFKLASLRDRLYRPSYSYDPGNQTPMLTTKPLYKVPAAKSKIK